MIAAEEIQHREACCQPYLLRLQMVTRGEGEPTLIAAEVGQATGPVVVEASAASRAALADGDSGHPGAETFLRVRLNRLARAAEEAIAAARDGDTAGLRGYGHGTPVPVRSCAGRPGCSRMARYSRA